MVRQPPDLVAYLRTLRRRGRAVARACALVLSHSGATVTMQPQRRKAVQVRTQELVGGQLPLVASGRSQRPYQQGPYHGQQAEWPYNTAPPT